MTDWLDRVYTARGDTARLAETYDAWASEYDETVGAFGYLNPAVACSLFTRLMPEVAAPVLDAGCGTGLIGGILHLIGYRELAGIDLSPGMLDRARARNVYRQLSRTVLGEPLPFEDGRFAGVIASGVFTVGHAPASAFDEIARVLAPGGIFAVSISDPAYEAGGFKARIEALESAGIWRLETASGGYVTMPGAGVDHRHLGRVYALRRMA